MRINRKDAVVKFLKANILTIATLIGVIIGVILGIALKDSTSEAWTRRQAMYWSYIGKLFLNMLKCIIIPLIIPSLIASIGALDLSLSGKIGLRAIVYYMATTVCAVILGLILVTAIQPGVGNEEKPEEDEGKKRNVLTADTLMDLIRNCFPPNIIQATVQQYRTSLIDPMNKTMIDPRTGALILPNNTYTWLTKGEWSNNTNILGLVVFSIVTGIAISVCGEEGKPLLKFFESISIVMMKVTTWIIYLAPVGCLFLIAGQILEMQNLAEEFGKLAIYFVTVLTGLAIHGFIILPLLYTVMTRSLPFRFILNMGSAIVTAWGTASSSATLPVTINCLEEKNKVDPRIARFVLPIGATINMDGTALYEAVAAIFIAQLHGVYPDLPQTIAIAITATAASIGAAGIPQAGLVTMVMVLDTVGLPSDAVAIILSVDWLLDRFRTALNVMGDAIGAGIVHHLSHKELEAMNEEGRNLEMDELKAIQQQLNGNTNEAFKDIVGSSSHL